MAVLTPSLLMIGPGLIVRGGVRQISSRLCSTNEFKLLKGRYLPTSVGENSIIKLVTYLFSIARFICICLLMSYDIVYIHSSASSSFFRKSIFVLLSKAFMLKVILHIHPTHFKNFLENSTRRSRFILSILRKCDGIVVLTKEMKHFLSFYLGGQKVFVLPNPIIVRQYDHPEDIPRQRLLVTYLGAILPEKGVFDLVKAFQRVIKRQPTAKLSIFGNKQLDLLRTIIQEASLQNHIEVNAWLSKRDLIKQIKTTGLLVLPSYSEGIPSILLEAMASKTPILTTKVGGIPEILTEASATFSDPGDIEDLAGKILFCLDHPNLLAQKAAIAYDSVLQYDLKTIAAKWLCIILEVYDNEHSSR